MSRASVVLNVLLVLVVAALSWALYARTEGGNTSEKQMSADSSGRTVPSPSGIDADTADRLAAQLTRIDARLAALETGASPGAAVSSAVQPAAPEMSAAEAERRLGQLLPQRQIAPQELVEFHAGLAALPPGERFALSTALARAINENRIRMRP